MLSTPLSNLKNNLPINLKWMLHTHEYTLQAFFSPLDTFHPWLSTIVINSTHHWQKTKAMLKTKMEQTSSQNQLMCYIDIDRNFDSHTAWILNSGHS